MLNNGNPAGGDTSNCCLKGFYCSEAHITADGLGQTLAGQHVAGVVRGAVTAGVATLHTHLQQPLAPLGQTIGQEHGGCRVPDRMAVQQQRSAVNLPQAG